jgi:hypothetical protein
MAKDKDRGNREKKKPKKDKKDKKKKDVITPPSPLKSE